MTYYIDVFCEGRDEKHEPSLVAVFCTTRGETPDGVVRDDAAWTLVSPAALGRRTGGRVEYFADDDRVRSPFGGFSGFREDRDDGPPADRRRFRLECVRCDLNVNVRLETMSPKLDAIRSAVITRVPFEEIVRWATVPGS